MKNQKHYRQLTKHTYNIITTIYPERPFLDLETDPQALPNVLVGVVVSDFTNTKAFSFQNRSRRRTRQAAACGGHHLATSFRVR